MSTRVRQALQGAAGAAAGGGVNVEEVFSTYLYDGTSASSYTITWPPITWVSRVGDTAPTLTAADTVVLFKISTTLYGVWVGSSA